MPKMMKFALFSLLALVLVACSGGGSGDSPSTVARSFMEAFGRLDEEAMRPLICSAQSDQVDGITESMAEAGTEVTIDVSNLTYQDGQISGDTATVNVSGDIEMEAMGQSMTLPVSDMFNGGALPMVRENGSWKVCPSDTGA